MKGNGRGPGEGERGADGAKKGASRRLIKMANCGIEKSAVREQKGEQFPGDPTGERPEHGTREDRNSGTPEETRNRRARRKSYHEWIARAPNSGNAAAGRGRGRKGRADGTTSGGKPTGTPGGKPRARGPRANRARLIGR